MHPDIDCKFLTRHADKVARERFEEEGQVPPHILAISKAWPIYIPLFFENTEQKAMVAQLIRQVFKAQAVERYVFVSEAWTIKRDPGQYQPGIAPMDCEDREEVVSISAFGPNEERSSLSIPIVRPWDGSKPYLGEGIDMSEYKSVGGIMSNLLPESLHAA